MKRGLLLATCLAAAAFLASPAQSQTPEAAPAAVAPAATPAIDSPAASTPAAVTPAPVAFEPIDLTREQPAGDLTGSLAIVRVPNLRGTLASVQSIIQTGMPNVPFDLVQIVGAKFQDPTLAGFPDGAGVAMIVTDSPTPDNVTIMAVAPGERAAYDARLKAQGLTTETVGELLVAARMPQSIPSVRPLLQNAAALMGENRTGIVADVNIPAIIRQFGPAIEMQIAEISGNIARAQAMQQSQAAPPAAAPGATPGATPAATPAPMPSTAKMVEAEFRIIYNIMKQVDTLRLTADMKPAGLALGKVVKPLPGSQLAGWFGASRAASGAPASQFLPGDGALRVAVNGANIGAAIDFFVAEFKAVAPQLAIPEADYMGFVEIMNEARNLYGGSLAANMMLAGGNFMDSSWAMEIKDEAATLAFVESMPARFKTSGIEKFYKDMGQTFTIAFQKNAREYNGVAIHKFTEDFTFSDPRQAAAMSAILGSNGHIEFEMAFVGNMLVQCSGTQKIESLIDGVKAGRHPLASPLKAQAAFAESAQGYFDFDLGAVLQKTMAAAMAGAGGQGAQAMPMMMMANMFTGVPPLSVAWRFEGDAAKSVLLIPVDLITRVGGQAMMMYTMASAGNQPGMGMQPNMGAQPDMGAQPGSAPQAAPPQTAPAPAPGTM